MGRIRNTLGRGDDTGTDAATDAAEPNETDAADGAETEHPSDASGGRRWVRLVVGLVVLGAVAYVLLRRRRKDAGFVEIELETEPATAEG